MIVSLSKRELDEGVLADHQELFLLLIIDDRAQVRHHALCKGLNFVLLGKPFDNLHQNFVHFFKQNILFELFHLVLRSTFVDR